MSNRLASAAVAALLLLGACASPGDGSDAGSDGSVDAATRIAEVRELRTRLAEPAVSLGRAATSLARAVEALRTAPPADPSARLAAATSARSADLAGLRAALDEEVALDDAGQGPDAVGARAAWRDAIGAASELADAAASELEVVGQLATADEELMAIVAVWDEPGSRRQQLDALAAAATRADTVAASLEGLEPDTPCLGDVERRTVAARFVADATRELRGHVAAHRGNAFDQRRAELTDDPFGTGGPLVEVDDPGCWSTGSPTGRAEARLRAALAALEVALNPADLEAPTEG